MYIAIEAINLLDHKRFDGNLALKLSWDLISSNKQWAQFLKARFMRFNGPVNYQL